MINRHIGKMVSRRFGMLEYFGGLAIALILVIGLTLAIIGYLSVVEITRSGMQNTSEKVTSGIENEVMYVFRYPIQTITTTLGRSAITEPRDLSGRLAYAPVLAAALKNYPNINGMHITYENGDFFALRRIVANDGDSELKAPANADYRVGYIFHRESLKERGLVFYDAAMTEIERRTLPSSRTFDPQTRSWYLDAMKAEGMAESDPFILASAGRPVVTFSRRAENRRAVVAVEVMLDRFSAVLERLRPTPNARIVLFQPDGDILGTSHGSTVGDGKGGYRLHKQDDFAAIIRMAMEAYHKGQRGMGINIHDGEQAWEVSIVELASGDGTQNVMVLAIPEADLVADGRKFLSFAFICLLGLLLFILPLMWFAMRRIVKPLHRLTEKAGRLAEFDADGIADMDSNVLEVHTLAHGISGQREQVKKILDIFRNIGTERDLPGLLSRVVRDVLTISGVDGGGVALSDGKGDFLDASTYYWKGEELQRIALPPPEKRDPALITALQEAMASETAYQHSISRETAQSKDPVLIPGFTAPDVIRVDEICIGLRDRSGEVLGVFLLCKSAKAGDPVFLPSQVAFMESLVAAVGIVLETQQLLRTQRDLRDGFVKILAGAIDAKSPYTGGHCERVPVIFQMLLQAACDAREGPLAEFSLDEDEWEETRLAGWLHDCGKVTTPEYVVDKATKLETICDRIHEIRTRFEVLKRDAEIDSLRAVIAGADAGEEREKLKTATEVLDREFAFVASCNIGGEDMDEEDLALLETIGQRTWVRTLDKRLGVSRDERARMDAAGAVEPPAREFLLMDNPEHNIPRRQNDSMPSDNPWGFKGTVPEALYNRGELYNLRIRRGTLTEEERYKINDHIRQTIIMLESIVWPKELRNMPSIAGGHHETMDGRGYPRGLRGEEMGLAARMMAIADIFEALTAWDRPYKPSKTLCEALEIMDGFRKRDHIDPVLYDLFVESGIPQRYAEKYLRPEQNDLSTKDSA